MSEVHNNRDHRKITVIDGKIGYTGGLNFADEYVNLTHPYGYWKDTAVRLEGVGVRSLTLMFLQLYNVRSKVIEDFTPFLPKEYEFFEGEGFVQPYGDVRVLFTAARWARTCISTFSTERRITSISPRPISLSITACARRWCLRRSAASMCAS